MADVLIVNESREVTVHVSRDGEPLAVLPRQEVSFSVAGGLSIDAGGDAMHVAVISQADQSAVLVTQGETGFELQPGQRFTSLNEVDLIHVTEIESETV